MSEPCTLSEQERQQLSSLLDQFDRARRDLHDRLGQIADAWDDQIASHPGDTAANDRLDALIRLRDQFTKEGSAGVLGAATMLLGPADT